MFGADPVDTISIKRCLLYFRLVQFIGIHAVLNDKYIHIWLIVYQKSYDEIYEH